MAIQEVPTKRQRHGPHVRTRWRAALLSCRTPPDSHTVARLTSSDLRSVLRLALPVAAVQLGLMAMGVIDTIMVGHLSPAALASAALGNLYFFIAGIFGQGTLMALDPVISQAVGAREDEAISRA